MNTVTISRLEATPAAIVVTTSDQKVIYWNGRGEALFGYTSTEAVGRLLPEIIVPPTGFKEEQTLFGKTLKSGTGSLECVRQRKNGSLVYVYVSNKVLRNAQGKVEFVLSSIKDMTRIRLLSELEEETKKNSHVSPERADGPKESEEQLRLFVENAEGYASCMLSPEGVITSWNIGAERVIGYKDKAIGRHFSCFYPLDLIALGTPEWDLRTALAQGHSEDEGWRLREDGQQFWANILMTALFHNDGLLKGFAMVIRDTTKQQQAEVTRLKNIELQNAAEAKDRFLANISHELRTPLNGIIGFAELLSDGKPGEVNLKQAEYLKDILSSGKHLLEIVTVMLDLAKGENGEMKFNEETFSIRDAIKEACAAIEPHAQGKGIRLSIKVAAELGCVTLDRQKFQQVLETLLSNAVKFSNFGGRAEILAEPHGPDYFKLVISDNGIGIQAKDLGRIFRQFEQVESGRCRRYEGTGLGLALALKIVELQGGTIQAESEVKQGSRFTVFLPLVAQACSKPAA